MKVAVYGRSGNSCMACRATKRLLERLGIEYDPHDVDNDAEALAYIKSVGVQQVPLVVAGEQHWSGFRPDLIKELARVLVA